METKKCTLCKIEKDIKDFKTRKNKNKTKILIHSWCLDCYKQYHKVKTKEWELKNREKHLIYRVKYNSERDNGLYMRWIGILKRINSDEDAYSYKSRGIKNLWSSYADFKRDMYNSFIEHLNKYGRVQTSLDRIDNDGHYCKENCRWADWKTQNNNKRKYRKKIDNHS